MIYEVSDQSGKLWKTTEIDGKELHTQTLLIFWSSEMIGKVLLSSRCATFQMGDVLFPEAKMCCRKAGAVSIALPGGLNCQTTNGFVFAKQCYQPVVTLTSLANAGATGTVVNHRGTTKTFEKVVVQLRRHPKNFSGAKPVI